MPWEGELSDSAGLRAGTSTWSAPANRGISSFASDEELLGTVGTETVESTDPQPGAAPGLAATAAPPAQEEDARRDFMADAATRALQRTIKQQSRMIRMLLILIIAVGLLLGAAIVMARQGADLTPATVADPSVQVDEQPTSEADQLSPSPEPQVPDGSVVPAAMLDGQTPQPEPVVQVPPPGWQADYQRAVELLDTASDGRIALDTRQIACEEALTILRGIRDTPGDGGHLPPQLDAYIATGERELERIRLEPFFP